MASSDSTASQPPSRAPERLDGSATRSSILWAAGPVALMSFLASVAGFAGEQHWTLDLLAHMSGHWLVLNLAATVVLLGCRAWRMAIVPLLGAALGLVTVGPLYVGSPSPTANGPRLRFMSANVQRVNRQFSEFLDFLEREDPDVVLVLEADQGWADAIEASTRTRLPHQFWKPRDDNFGIGLISKLPLESVEFEILTEDGKPTVFATLRMENQAVSIIGSHPVPPMGGRLFDLRNQHLEVLAQRASAGPSPRILAGDFNVTPYSPIFRQLLATTQLHDARRGFGAQATWTTRLPWPFRIPIDQILVSKRWAVRDFRASPNFGSDHLAVTADLQLAE